MAADNEIDLRRYVYALRSHRWLFAAIFAVIFGLGLTYALTRPTRYNSVATVLIEDGSSDLAQRSGAGALAMMMRSFSIGGFSGASVDNEMVLVASHDIAYRTVRKLSLNVTCVEPQGLTKRPLWHDAPATLLLPPGMADSMTARDAFTVTLHIAPDGEAEAKALRGRIFSATLATARGKLPLALDTPMGTVTLTPSDTVAPRKEMTVKYTVTGYQAATERLLKELDIDLAHKAADAISVELTGDCPARDRAILNTLLDEYNYRRTEQRRTTAQTEVDFLNDRIENLFGELIASEKKIEEFKTRSNFVNIDDEAPIILESSLDAREQLLKANSEILYCEQVLDALHSSTETMLPAYAIPGSDSEANPMVTAYNDQLAMLNELRRSAMPGNQALQRAEERVAQMRESVIESVSQTLAAARKAVKARSGVIGQMDSHLRKLPQFEREYINLSRDNLIKNELYAFLMEKRESSLLKYYSRATLGFIVDPAYTAVKPNYTRPVAFAGISLILALMCVGGLALIFTWRSTTVRRPCDVATAGFEKQTFVRGTDPIGYANDIRALITGRFPEGTIYVATLSSPGHPVEEEIIGAFRRAEYPVAEITDEAANDSLLSSRMKDKIRSQEADYVFVTVPDTGRLADISSLVGQPDALLLLIAPAGSLKRAEAMKLAEIFTPDRIILVIC